MSLITSYFNRPKGAKPPAAASSQPDDDDFEAPVKKGVKRGREPAAKETTTATKAKAREPPAKKVKKAAEELPWPDIVQEGTEDEPTPKAKPKASAATSTRPTLRAKRRPKEEVSEKEEEEAQPKRSTPTKKKAKKAPTKQQQQQEVADDIPWDDDVEDVDDIPWDQPTTTTPTTTTPTKKAATARTARGETPGESPGKKSKAAAAAKPEPKSPVKKAKPSEAKSPAKSTTTTVIERKTPVVEKKVVEAKPAPAKRGGGGGGYPFWLQNRAGPPHLGMKDLPEGKPWCLWGKVFMCTGVLDSLERDDCFKLIEHYGGTVAKSVTKKLTHAVVGTDAGAKKLEQIEARKAQGLVAMDEDGLFELIRNSPEQRPSAAEIAKFNKQRKTEGAPAKPKALQTAAPLLPSPTPASAEEEQKKGPELWVEKYKPKSTKEVIANPAAVKKLQDWLQGWQRSEVQRAKRGEAPARGATQKNAALLSGPPGIGKTTTAHLVAAECGYYALEFNASDTRSKKMIKEHLAQSTENRGLAEFFSAQGRGGEDGRTVLIMDEVDGMSAGDRGGMAEIIALIKKTHIPIICLCNDRASAKVRSLANYCLDIQLQKPTTQQILGRVTQILQRENIAIDNATLTRIVDASNGDVRQLLNMLQMLTVKSKDLGTLPAPELQERLRTSLKEVELGPMDAVNKLFNATEYQKLSLDAKLDLYFIDPSFVPLFIQENYLHCRPRRARNVSRNPEVERLVEMDLISQAADSFSEADLFDVAIHRDQDWSLAPVHGVFSVIRPAEFMTGNLAGRIDFPKWLGKFSSRKKRFRLLTELAVRMSATTSGDKALLRLDYLPHLVRPLTVPLAKKGADGIDEVLALMDAYGITREDWDTVLELMELGDRDWAKTIPTNVKTAFTRKYKAAHLAVKSAPARKGAVNYVLPEEAAQGRDGDDEADEAFNDDEADEGEGKGDEEDSMIVARASKKAKGGAAAKKPSARGGAAGRGRGRGGRGETAKAKAK